MNWLKQQVANATGTQEPIYGSSAIRAVTEQAKSVAYSDVSKDDLKWIGMPSTCVETQSFYFMSDSGHIALAQVMYSNVAGLRITCQFNCKIFYPDRTTPSLWTSDVLENHGFDDSRLCFFADGCAVDLSEDGTSYTIKSVINEEAVMNLKVTRLSPGFQVGKDGRSLFGTDLENPWGSMRHTFWPRCSAEGTIITKSGPVDLQGRAIFIHGLQGMKPHHAAAKWNFVDFQTPTYSAVMMEFTTPPSYGSTVVNVGGIAVDGKIICAGSTNSVSHLRVKEDEENNWPEPEEIKYTWSGSTKEGKPVTAEVVGPLGKRLDRIDIMAEVPSFVKQIVGGIVGTKPYIYQYSPEPRLKVRINIDGNETVEEGTMFAEATFMSE